jgi:hypothetical protein
VRTSTPSARGREHDVEALGLERDAEALRQQLVVLDKQDRCGVVNHGVEMPTRRNPTSADPL